VERGDPGVGMGIYASVLECYGLLPRLEEIVDRRLDRLGLALEATRLPQRIRTDSSGYSSLRHGRGSDSSAPFDE
jgi:hypothetical protein